MNRVDRDILQTEIIDLFESHKSRAHRLLEKGNYDSAAFYMKKASSLMYGYNLVYADGDLENMLRFLSSSFSVCSNEYSVDSNKVTIIDAFGLSFRGLAWIYARAVIDSGKKLQFILSERHAQSSVFYDLRQYLYSNGATVSVIPEKSVSSKIKTIENQVLAFGSSAVLYHGTPWDVESLAAIGALPNQIKKVQIDLTDHAFWMGSTIFDCYLEFREYGCSIAHYRRGIPLEKLFLQPYYPTQLNSAIPFQGLPFDDNARFFLSGGSSYKTEGSALFPEMVMNVLSSYPWIHFLFLSNQKPSWWGLIEGKYEGRVFLEKERADILEVMKRAEFYLSTYPFYGGLMTQLAAAAGTIPVTLLLEGSEPSGKLLYDESLTIDYFDTGSVFEEISLIITNDSYRMEKSTKVSDSLLTPDQFAKRLIDTLNGETFNQCAGCPEPDDGEFVETCFKQNHTYSQLAEVNFQKRDLFHGTLFDQITWVGFIKKLMSKCRFSISKRPRRQGK